MSTLRLHLHSDDKDIQHKNFEDIESWTRDQEPLKFEFKFFDLDIPGAVTNQAYFHGFGYKPLDIIQTASIGAGILTFNYNLFDDKIISVSTTGAVRWRGMIGLYREHNE